MRQLFKMDTKDYDLCTSTYQRDSARSIIISDGKVAMVHSLKYDYYKFPGGGIECGETPIQAMIRETKEEAGLIVIPESIQEYGLVYRIKKSDEDPNVCFIQNNYYYLCKVEEKKIKQTLDEYEEKEGFVLEFVEPQKVITTNLKPHPFFILNMAQREAKVLQLLVEEHCF